MTTNARTRTAARDVFFADSRNPSVDLGGLVATPGTTNEIFHVMVEIAMELPAESEYRIQDADGTLLPRDNSQLRPGRYLILSNVPVVPSSRRYFTRTLSGTTGTRLQAFKQQVRDRDRRCVISKEPSLGPQYDIWEGFEAAHIVPLAYANEWRSRGFSRLITVPPPQNDTINSVQNGLLMQSTLHALFDSYIFSILPEAGYKVITFVPGNPFNLADKSLDRELLDDERRPPDALLRWHFEQAVLRNVRGAGEPEFDSDFPSGSDMMGHILSAPKAAERMEFELFTRLGASQILPE